MRVHFEVLAADEVAEGKRRKTDTAGTEGTEAPEFAHVTSSELAFDDDELSVRSDFAVDIPNYASSEGPLDEVPKQNGLVYCLYLLRIKSVRH